MISIDIISDTVCPWCFIGKKRLYMTATPKIYGEKPKKKAEEGEVVLASMDDEKTFGPKFFYRGFNWAVENNLLTDYKVVILAIDEGKVSKNLQRSFEEGAELKLDDATKIIGCYKALAKVGFDKSNNHNKDIKPIKRALAFSQNIEISKIFKNEFKNVVDEYISNDKIESQYKTDLEVEIEHIDGTFNADLRNERLNWLKKEEIDENKCKILTNVRCLSEGVDVPTLDAILFLHPRKSQVDVVQSVGRVMRKAPGKNLGYVILPIAVAPGVSPEKAINDSERFSVVWQVLNALRAHNDRFDNTINRMKLGEDVSKQIQIINIDSELEALTTEVEDIKDKYDSKPKEDEKVIGLNQDNEENKIEDEEKQLAFEIGDLSQAIKAKIVEKCGTRDYWENWANDIAKIAKTHISRINGIVLNSKKPERKFFLRFLEEIRDDLNPEITENEAVEMLAQHIITQPVFQTLFQGNKFTQDNAISKSLEGILKKIYEQNIKKESKTLEKFYDSVKRRAKDIVTSKGRTRLINELYERFFKNAFPLTTSRLGIVYTPIEIVDFIINSAESILKKEFKSSFGNKNVNIIDPFVGTGTFITRLLQSGFIQKGDLSYKYKNEIHANEIILLAYYIAGINIESVYQDLVKTNHYQPFNKIILTDTFQLYEQERDMIANLLPDNSNRRTNQKKIDMRVIIGNPPYSIGQTSEGDNAANVSYNNLDKQIKMTYGKDSKATNQRGLYDSYIRSFRWATDRISKNNGVIGFVTGSGWIDKNFADGLRKHFVNDFTSIHIINLRGDIRKTMLSKNNDDEGENVFGQGSMTGTSITILTKNKKKVGNKIFYYDIGKNKKRKEKLYLLRRFKSIDGIGDKFKICTPDKNYDWINKGDLSFEKFIPIGEKKEKKNSIFKNYSLGIATNRDTWCYDFSKIKLKNKIKLHIDFYNSEMKRYKNVNKNIKVEDFINVDRTKIAWTRNLKKALANLVN